MIGSPLVIAEQARARMQVLLAKMQRGEEVKASGLTGIFKTPPISDVVITACEVSPAHGTGTLLLRIFPNNSEIISLRTSNFYSGEQEFGGAQHCLPLAHSSYPEIVSWVKWCLAGTSVRRILALPYLPADPLVAFAVQEVTKAPLCTYIMDDKNVCTDGIDDALMTKLVERSALRLVISPEMREAYSAKYGVEFYVMPPLVPESLIRRVPVQLSEKISHYRGVLLGNIWGQHWLDKLRLCLRGSGVVLDWYCNQKKPAGLNFETAELAEDGIIFHPPASEMELPELLSRYAFALVPTDTLDGSSPPNVRAIAELSLPSRIPTMVSMAHLPMLVVGSHATCASRFVTRFGLGEVVPYETRAILAAVNRLNQSAIQASIRSNAAQLADRLSAEGSAAWIWNSLARGRPVDMRFEDMMPPVQAP